MFSTEIPQLKFLQFNVENLFLYLDLYQNQDLEKITEEQWQKLSSSVTSNKSLYKTKELAKLIMASQADVVMLNEVGGEESIRNFAHYFLKDQYVPYLKEGNSHRGIDVGYLLKKDLPLKPVLISHKNRPIHFLYPHETKTPAGGQSHYFSRDVAELRLFKSGENTPCLVILLTHLKSKLDPDLIDAEGKLRRRAELETLIQIYHEIRRELEFKVPIVVSGDFNGIARKPNYEPEFDIIHSQTDWLDCLEIAARTEEERFSQVQVYSGSKPRKVQIDYIFISPDLKPFVDAAQTQVFLFQNHLGQNLPLPETFEERGRLPSDHYPILLTLKPQK